MGMLWCCVNPENSGRLHLSDGTTAEEVPKSHNDGLVHLGPPDLFLCCFIFLENQQALVLLLLYRLRLEHHICDRDILFARIAPVSLQCR